MILEIRISAEIKKRKRCRSPRVNKGVMSIVELNRVVRVECYALTNVRASAFMTDADHAANDVAKPAKRGKPRERD